VKKEFIGKESKDFEDKTEVINNNMISFKDLEISLNVRGKKKKDDIEEMYSNKFKGQLNEKDQSPEMKINHKLANNQGRTQENHNMSINEYSKNGHGNINYIKFYESRI